MTKQLKILIIEGSQDPPAFVKNLINGLLSKGLSITLVGDDTRVQFTPLITKNFKRIKTNFIWLNKIRILCSFIIMLNVDFKAIKFAYRIANKDDGFRLWFKNLLTFSKIIHNRPDVIHFQWATHIGNFESIIRSNQFATLLSLRGRQITVLPKVSIDINRMYTNLFPFIDQFHAVSDNIGQEVIEYGVPFKKVNVIHSFALQSFIDEFEIEKKLNQKELKIISVGRFNWIKGYTDALLAMRELVNRKINFRYTIIASGKVPLEVLYIIRELQLSNFINISKPVLHNKIAEEFKTQSVFLLPSVREGIANVVIEAMAVGLPVISTDCGGMSELIRNDYNGWLVPVRDPSAISRSLLHFKTLSCEKINKIRKNAHETIKEKFNEKKSIDKFIGLYDLVGGTCGEKK